MSKLYKHPRFPLIPIREIALRLQYGTSSLATTETVGLPIVRMNNLQNDGWDFTDLKYIDLPSNEAEDYRIIPGDILFNRTNSKELVGKCEVFREKGHWVFASYLIRVSLDQSKAIPEFVSGFLNTKAGRAQIDRVSRQIVGMANVNAEEIRELLIPLPSLKQQSAFVAELEAARQSRQAKLTQADDLLSGLDAYLLAQLGLKPPKEDRRQTFAVHLRQLRGKRLDATSYQPLFAQEDASSVTIKSLQQIADIDSNRISPPMDEDTLVPYIGLPECNLTEVREVVMRPYREVKGRSVVRPGDILFARIEPSVFNKKYVLADDLKGHRYAYTSTEFYVVQAKETEVLQQYLYALFFCSFVFIQVKGKTTGSSGRRRIDSEMFRGLQIPTPKELNFEVQKKIITEFMRCRTQARQLRGEAAREWAAAKARFERRLLGEEA